MSVASRKKQPVTVRSVGNLAQADFRGLAGLLLRLKQQTSLKVVTNEQQGSALSAKQ
jgi:hypothetical protein